MNPRLSDDDIAALAPLWDPQAGTVRPEDPRGRMRYMVVGPNLAGVRVTMETASQVSVVWACQDVIAKPLACSDWNVFERLGPKRRREMPDDTLAYLLNTRPNPEMTAQSFRRAMMIGALSWGNGYAEIVRDRAGRVAELYPICPDRVEPTRAADGRLIYEVSNGAGANTYLESEDTFHVRGPSITGLVGDNVIGKATASIALAMATHKFAAAYFGNGTNIGGIMEYPGELDDQTFDRLERNWNGKHQGPNRAFRTGWIDRGMKYIPVDSNAEKAQLVTARQQDIEDICRYWGVPPHKVQHLLRSTNNNIEHQGLEFTRDCLRPWTRELQQEADYKLFSSRGPKRFTLIDIDWAAEGDFKSRMEGLQIGRNMGVINGNEVRAEIGYDDMGPQGDLYIVQGAMTKLKDVGKVYEKTGAAPAGDGQADAEDPAEAPIKAWLCEVFARAARRQANRRADLEDKNIADAAAQARRDAVVYLEQQLATAAPHLAAWAGKDCDAELARHGIAALTDSTPEAAAAALINELKEAR